MPFSSLAEKVFWEEVRYNTALAPCRAKPKAKEIGRKMTPDEILEKLKEWGLAIDRRTLTNYVKWGLVAAPKQRSGGKGVKADYPDHAVAEAATAAWLMRQGKWKKEHVANARKVLALMYELGDDVDNLDLEKIKNGRYRKLMKIYEKTPTQEVARDIIVMATEDMARFYWKILKHFYAMSRRRKSY